ncbi:MAG: OsmC family protein [Bacteroidetes bacterium]|nr:OsmC family protein [Bacteroidota bacterium]
MAQEHFYDVTVQWVSDRKGSMTSTVLDEQIEVATPPEFPKGMAGIWSPEHLLVAAVNSCLMTTFLAIAENSKLTFSTFTSKAVGKLEIVEGKYMISEITLIPTLEILSEDQRERAFKVLQKSEAACLISNSVKSRIIFQPQILVLAEEVVA